MTHPEPFEWTQEQARALDLMHAHLCGPPAVFVLTGSAGTGKTTLTVAGLADAPRVCFTAPTHKAVGVLAGRGTVPGAEYATIHRLLGCKRQRVDGKTAFLPDMERAAWPEFPIIVIDEVSMVGETMWQWIMDAQAMWPRHVICMGDPAQLPPVQDGDGLSPAFAHTSASLTEVKRSAGSVLAAAHRVRLHLGDVEPVAIDLDPGKVDQLEREEFFDSALADFKADRDVKVLAWTNAAVDFLNRAIREALFGVDVPDAPQEGERRVVVSTWSDPDDSVMLHAERELTIASATPCEHLELPAWKIRAEGVDATLYQLRPEGVAEHKRRLSNLRHECRSGRAPWHKFYALDDAFISLRPGYATTVHKSQGSTYQTAYVVDRNLKQCPDHLVRNMLRYVAFSRAAQRLVVS